ncbi:MAG: SurA N-terminal domain-containing protein [Elusimicrobia bacterium]|jgi:peptidyl-prolyl cis-trans isomerase D|nr:SurA N-terminal domain-containing protein [Elusimicrobiota bacterium]
MLDNIRKHTDKIMWFIAALFIGGLFFWYGTGGTSKNTVVEADNFTIEVSDYRSSLNRTLRNKREETETELSENQITRIKQQVLSTMVNTETLFYEAKKMGLSVTDNEVAATIRNLPQFQQDGRFNNRLYKQALLYSMNMNPAEFEELIRKDIYTKKIERIILSTAEVTEPELQLAYMRKNGSLEGYQKDKEELKNSIVRQKRMSLYRQWMTDLRRNMNLTVNPKLAGLQ